MTDEAAADSEVRLTHLFDAPIEAVFHAWTDPQQVARWWAPDGFEIPPESVTIEPEVGGCFHLAMVERGGDGRFPYRAEFVELSAPELIVLRAEPITEAGIGATTTRVELRAEGAGTRMTVTMGPYTAETRGSAEAGMREIIANLERLL